MISRWAWFAVGGGLLASAARMLEHHYSRARPSVNNAHKAAGRDGLGLYASASPLRASMST